jgi:acyl-CoA thioester hydrolase
MPASVFRHDYRVTYADCTVGNHVYYGRYLEFLEFARGEFFRHLGSSFVHWQGQDAVFPVVECRLRYRAPARYDDQLEISLRLSKVERTRLNFAYSISRQDGLLILEAETWHACTTVAGKPRKLPDSLCEKLMDYLKE